MSFNSSHVYLLMEKVQTTCEEGLTYRGNSCEMGGRHFYNTHVHTHTHTHNDQLSAETRITVCFALERLRGIVFFLLESQNEDSPADGPLSDLRSVTSYLNTYCFSCVFDAEWTDAHVSGCLPYVSSAVPAKTEAQCYN